MTVHPFADGNGRIARAIADMALARWEGSPRRDRMDAVVNQLLDGFEGKLTSSKWAALTKCSQDTALRDIADLVERGVLVKEPVGGRSTSYALHASEVGGGKPR